VGALSLSYFSPPLVPGPTGWISAAQRGSVAAKVEQVRLLITDQQRLNPAAAAIYIITNGVALTDDETEIWNRFQAQASTMLKAHGIDAGPAIHCDVSDLKASVYRVTVPVHSAQLTALRFQ
jgi:hypothetical protein